MIRPIWSAVAAVLLLSGPCWANYGNIDEMFPYSHNSGFVRYPAHAVGAVVAVPGAIVTGALVCPFMAMHSHFERYSGFSYADCVGGGAIIGFWGGTAIGGAPFYVLEEAFWVLPHTAVENSGALDHPQYGTVKNGRVVWDESPNGVK